MKLKYIFIFLLTTSFFGQKTKKIITLLKQNDSLYKIAVLNKNDSLRNIALKKYIKLYYQQKNWEAFNKTRFEHLNLTNKLNDSLSKVRTLEYTAAYYRKQTEVDSSYFYYRKSLAYYEGLKDTLNIGLMLLNVAIIQKNSRDFSGSEYTSLKAINYLEKKATPRRISSAYNNLGVIYGYLNNYETSLKYHLKALELRKKNKNSPIYIVHSLNNIGDLFISHNKYTIAIEYLEEALKYLKTLEAYPKIKAAVIDNYAYAQFKRGKDNKVLAYFTKAIELRKENNDKYGLVNTYLHLADYYSKKDIAKAVFYAEKGVVIAKKIKNYQGLLRLYKFLGNTYKEEKSKEVFNKLETLRDSLEIADKAQRESFYKIELMVHEKNSLLIKQEESNKRKTNTIRLLIITFILLVIMGVIFNTRKNKKQKKIIQEIENKEKKGFLSQHYILNEADKEKFNNHLVKKFGLTTRLVEFWEHQVKGVSEAEIAEKIQMITEGAVKKRRTKLYKKIKEFYPKLKSLNKVKSIEIYNQELKMFVDTYIKK